MHFMPFLSGFALSFSLVSTIGAQNAFLIRCATRGRFVLLVSAIFFGCDIALMTSGVFGIGNAFAKNATISLILSLVGIAFAGAYAAFSLKSALKPAPYPANLAQNLAQKTDEAVPNSNLPQNPAQISAAVTQNSNLPVTETATATKTIAVALAVTLLNPQVYFDTVFLVGATSMRLGFGGKLAFLAGSLVASAGWFFGFGLLARSCSGLLSRPRVRRAIDLFVALVMIIIAASLTKFALSLA